MFTFRKFKSLTFWHYQVTGWVIFYVVMQVIALVYRRGTPWEFFEEFVEYVAGFCLTLLLRQVFKRIRFKQIPLPLLIGIITLSAVLVALVWYFAILGIVWVMLPGAWMKVMRISAFLNFFFVFVPVLFGWNALYFGIKFWLEWSFQKDRAEKADLLAQSAQLQMLRYQLNPHFLFNSLNSIRALIDEDTRTSKEMITELSEFLRYSLISKNYANVPLSDELEAMAHYFNIEKKRYEEKLQVEWDIDPLAEDYPVLSFLVHPLVENAVKYGMKTSALPLRIRIAAGVEGDNLTITVSNTGKWVEQAAVKGTGVSGTGTGLDNVRMRLENAFPGHHKMEIHEENGWVTIRLNIRKGLESNHEKEIQDTDRR